MATEQELAAKIRRMVRQGRLDNSLKELMDSLSARRQALYHRESLDTLSAIGPGDTVQVKGGIRPQYLQNMRGTVVEVSTKTRNGLPMVLVNFGRPFGKFKSGKVLFSAGSLEPMTVYEKEEVNDEHTD